MPPPDCSIIPAISIFGPRGSVPVGIANEAPIRLWVAARIGTKIGVNLDLHLAIDVVLLIVEHVIVADRITWILGAWIGSKFEK